MTIYYLINKIRNNNYKVEKIDLLHAWDSFSDFVGYFDFGLFMNLVCYCCNLSGFTEDEIMTISSNIVEATYEPVKPESIDDDYLPF